MKDNQNLEIWRDKCPEHNTPIKSEYEFGNKMHPSMVVSVFDGCECAVSHRDMQPSKYHISYASAKSAAILQKEMDYV